MSKRKIRAIDLFCGIGGSSWGARKAGVQIVAGFDLWTLASKVFKDNFPEAIIFSGKLEDSNPKNIARKLGKIDLILASPECTNHSPARGNRAKSEESKETAFQVIRYARVLRPRWIVIENVLHMKKWERYSDVLNELRKIGYHILEQILNAGDFRVPQSRQRLFILCDLESDPAGVSPCPNDVRPARDAINMNGQYPFSALEKPGRAAATLERANRAMETVGKERPFILVYYSSDGPGGWQSLDVPLRTITTVDRFALVRPGEEGPVMRMLQVPELKKAMGFPLRFKIRHGTRRDQIHLLGNAVCPPVMEAVVRSLIRKRT